MIAVKRNRDGKVFSSDMSKDECIYEIHFCTSYTQVMIYEVDENGDLKEGEIICDAVGTRPCPLDLIATDGDDRGEFIICQ